ncbi:MAG: methyltransferase domain-containing protein [bacterium]|nr:methyltransferase domain-containing protein [bacterium]
MESDSLKNHYHQPELIQKIYQALKQANIDPAQLNRQDLDLLDEFHIRGREATVELAALVNLQKHHRVLDAGCGLGGPARFLADQFKCQVTGMDLVESYCEVASELTDLVGLSYLVKFQQGDMQKMPFADDEFDFFWSQHTTMNIPDKSALVAEVSRVLRPGGKAVFYEVCQGNGLPVHLPVPWASETGHSFLPTANELRMELSGSSLQEEHWEDVTAIALQWIDGLNAGLKGPVPKNPARPNLGLVMGEQASIKSKNMFRNLNEGRILVVQGVFNNQTHAQR